MQPLPFTKDSRMLERQGLGEAGRRRQFALKDVDHCRVISRQGMLEDHSCSKLDINKKWLGADPLNGALQTLEVTCNNLDPSSVLALTYGNVLRGYVPIASRLHLLCRWQINP